MADSIRLAVLKEISAFIAAEVTTANGYDFDLTGKVSRGRILYGANSLLPAVTILESLNPDRNPSTTTYSENLQKDFWELLLQGRVADDVENPTDPAHNLMACVKIALAKIRESVMEKAFPDTSALNAVVNMVIEPGTVRPPDDISDRAYFWLRIGLEIVEDVSDPFWIP